MLDIKQKHINHLKKKYSNYQNIDYQNYGVIDTYVEINDKINSSKFISKGAFNLFNNFGYTRNIRGGLTLTEDADFSINDFSMDEIEVYFSDLFCNFKSNFYTISNIRFSNLTISSNKLGGKRIEFTSTLIGGRTRFECMIDIAYEDIPDSPTILQDEKGRRYYSIERTLADKYCASVSWGIQNKRTKDYIDIVSLYEKIENKQLFFDAIKILLFQRDILIDKVRTWKYSWQTVVSVLTNKWGIDSKIVPIFDEINNAVLSEVHQDVSLKPEI